MHQSQQRLTEVRLPHPDSGRICTFSLEFFETDQKNDQTLYWATDPSKRGFLARSFAGSDDNSLFLTRSKETMQRLTESPFIIKTYPHFLEENSSCFIRLEQLGSGSNLKALLERGRFSEQQLKEVARCGLQGLIQMSQAAVVHTSINLETLIKASQCYKYTRLDWSSRDLAEREFEKDNFIYVPPEYLSSNQSIPSTKGDIYSLGVVLFRLLFSQTPYLQRTYASKRKYLKALAGSQLKSRVDLTAKLPSKSAFLVSLVELVMKMIQLKKTVRANISDLFKFVSENWLEKGQNNDRIKQEESHQSNNSFFLESFKGQIKEGQRFADLQSNQLSSQKPISKIMKKPSSKFLNDELPQIVLKLGNYLEEVISRSHGSGYLLDSSQAQTQMDNKKNISSVAKVRYLSATFLEDLLTLLKRKLETSWGKQTNEQIDRAIDEGRVCKIKANSQRIVLNKSVTDREVLPHLIFDQLMNELLKLKKQASFVKINFDSSIYLCLLTYEIEAFCLPFEELSKCLKSGFAFQADVLDMATKLRNIGDEWSSFEGLRSASYAVLYREFQLRQARGLQALEMYVSDSDEECPSLKD